MREDEAPAEQRMLNGKSLGHHGARPAGAYPNLEPIGRELRCERSCSDVGA